MMNRQIQKILYSYFTLFLAVQFPAQASTPVAKVISIKGKAWLVSKSDAKTEVKSELKKDAVLQSGDSLSTENEGEVILLVGEKEAALLLKKNSKLKILTSNPSDWEIRLDEGMLLSNVRPQENTKRKFQVRTPVAVMGVRGTTFFVKQEPGKSAFLCTCDGIISVDNKAIILGKNHNAPKWIQPGQTPISKRLKNAEPGSDHSNSEAAPLAQLLL